MKQLVKLFKNPTSSLPRRSSVALAILAPLCTALACGGDPEPGDGDGDGDTTDTGSASGGGSGGPGTGGVQGGGSGPGTGGTGTGSGTGSGGVGGGGGPGTGGRPNGGGGDTGGGTGGGGNQGGSSFEETGTQATCTFTINAVPADEMPTVGVVDFTVTGLAAPVTAGVIQFGLTTDYTLEAPVDTAAANNKTLMLGMKKSSTYNYRIGVATGTEYCYSDNMTIESGGLRAGINDNITSNVTGTVAPGFMVVASKSSALIIDKDGSVVWGYTFDAGGGGGGAGSVAGIFAAKMSFDGKHMLARDLGQFDAGDQGKFFRVAMDGSDLSSFDVPGGDHHDFTVTPTGFAYIAKAEKGQFDQIYTSNSDGTNAKPLASLQPFIDAYPQAGGMGSEKSHVNAIHYWQERQIYTVSNRESDALAVVSSTGEVQRGIGKQATASFETVFAKEAGSDWRVQHGHDLYEDNKLLVFSNGSFSGGSSKALHYTITGTDAKLDWSYSATGNSGTQGDVQMLPNGNVLITASNAGNIHEINAQQQLQASYSAGSQGLGYVTHRPSLYGAPPDGR